MKLRSTFTPSSSKPIFSLLPTIPIAKITRSKFCVSSFPSCERIAVTPFAPVLTDFTCVFVFMVKPRFSKAFCAIFEISASSAGKIRSTISTTVVSAPNAEKKLANSIPIAPDPITSKRPGIVSGVIASRAVQIYFPSGSKPAGGIVRARAPVAKMTCLAV